MYKYKSQQAGQLQREHCLAKFSEFYYHKILLKRLWANVITTAWAEVPTVNVYLLSKFDVSGFSVTEDI